MDTIQKEDFDVEDQKLAIKLNILILRTWGYWPPETDDQSELVRYRIYAVLILSLTFVSYVFLEIISVLTADNMEDVVFSSLVLFTHFMQFGKLYCMHSRRSDIIEVMNKLNQKVFIPQSRRQKKLLQKQVRRGKIHFYVFLILSVCTVSLWYIFPLIETTEKLELPLKVWFPFDIHIFPVFQIVYVYQFSVIMLNAIIEISMVAMVSNFMANVCGQLDILNDKLQSLGKTENYGKHQRNRSEPCVSEMHEYKTIQALEDCIKHHFKIIE